jgi:hypothetical protein
MPVQIYPGPGAYPVNPAFKSPRQKNTVFGTSTGTFYRDLPAPGALGPAIKRRRVKHKPGAVLPQEILQSNDTQSDAAPTLKNSLKTQPTQDENFDTQSEAPAALMHASATAFQVCSHVRAATRVVFGTARRFAKEPPASTSDPRSFNPANGFWGPNGSQLAPRSTAATFGTAIRTSGPASLQKGKEGCGPGNATVISSFPPAKPRPQTARMPPKPAGMDYRPGPGEYKRELTWGAKPQAAATFGKPHAIKELHRFLGTGLRYGLHRTDHEHEVCRTQKSLVNTGVLVALGTRRRGL